MYERIRCEHPYFLTHPMAVAGFMTCQDCTGTGFVYRKITPPVCKVITVPLPPDELRTNRVMGQHWSSVLKVKAVYQLQVVERWKLAGQPTIGERPAHLTITVYLAKGQRADPSDIGSWMKSGLDALKGKAWFDDGSKYLNPVTVRIKRDWHQPRVELSWEE